MTKQKLFAQLLYLSDLKALYEKKATEMMEATSLAADQIPALLGKLKAGVPIGALENELPFCKEDGKPEPVVRLTPQFNGYHSLEISFGGSTLCADIGTSDCNTPQAFITVKSKDGSVADLALAEVKKGTLAALDGLPDGNKDVDLYVWGNADNEDYTQKLRLPYAELFPEDN